MTNDGSAINEWACEHCGKHIGDGDTFIRISWAVDRAGARYMLSDPELLLGDEYCSPHCAAMGSVGMLERLKKNARVEHAFDPEVVDP